MTAIARSGYVPLRKKTILSPLHLNAEEVSLIMPVKDNLEGVLRFLVQLQAVTPPSSRPGQVIVVDNNSAVPVQLPDVEGFTLLVIRCEKPGPAAARNAGAACATGKWLLFADSDCVPTPETLVGYASHLDGSVGYAGWVKALGNDVVSQYYDSQEILIPPHSPVHPEHRPEYLITCNCLIWREAFDAIGGFKECFPKAAGEDVDLGYRLREFGTLAYAEGSVMLHDFSDGMDGFVSRFIRYGEGNRHLQMIYPDLQLAPNPFEPNVPSLVNRALARLQYEALKEGWLKGIQLGYSTSA